MAKVSDTILFGGRIPHEMHAEILERCRLRKVSKSVYAESIFEFWDALGRPDLDEMRRISDDYQASGRLDRPRQKPDISDPEFLDQVAAALDRLDALEKRFEAKSQTKAQP